MSTDPVSIDRRAQRALEKAIRVPPPPGLLRTLLSIPASAEPKTARGWPPGWQWLAAPAALAAVAVVAFMLAPNPRQPEQALADMRATEAAVRDFTLAMTYLQKTTEIAGRHTGREIGNGMLDALALSREAILDSDTTNNGG